MRYIVAYRYRTSPAGCPLRPPSLEWFEREDSLWKSEVRQFLALKGHAGTCPELVEGGVPEEAGSFLGFSP
jgi:hypothetical protein